MHPRHLTFLLAVILAGSITLGLLAYTSKLKRELSKACVITPSIENVTLFLERDGEYVEGGELQLTTKIEY